VVVLLRLNRQYEQERAVLEVDVPAAVRAPIKRRHVVLVFVDRLDLAAARAVQYARTLTPDELRAVHFSLDPQSAEELSADWAEAGMSRIPLDVVATPDRRLTRAAVEVVARDLADGETEVSVLLPDRKYRGFWHRILHDQTADAIEREISRLPHANVTTVPFHFQSRKAAQGTGQVVEAAAAAQLAPPRHAEHTTDTATTPPPQTGTNGHTPIAAVQWRQRITIEGRIRTIRVQPLGGTSTLECIIEDDTGAMSLVFLGRANIPGINVGTHLRAHGIAGQHRGRLAILNPDYQLLAH
jgi:hypothetical protein